MFTLPSLTYDYDALEPHIDAETMKIHHTKHHQAYIDKLNAAVKGKGDLESKPVEELLMMVNKLPEEIQMAVRNHGGGHANHSLFWTIIGPNGGGEPSGKLADDLKAQFGSFASFKTKFSETAAGQFGSGWGWLGWNETEGLHVHSMPNQDSPYLHGDTPIMGLDVWEHAYYLKYQNRRPEYIEAFWNVVDWNAVAERYQQVAG